MKLEYVLNYEGILQNWTALLFSSLLGLSFSVLAFGASDMSKEKPA